MNTDRDSLSYGQYLKSTRQAKGISLEEISRETRIGRDLLLSIEREDDAALPAEVFVKGFLKAYAEAVGLDGGEVVRRYATQHPGQQEKATSRKLYTRPPRRRWPLLAAVFGAMGLLVFLSVFLVTGSRSPGIAPSPAVLPGEKSGASSPSLPEPSAQLTEETAPDATPPPTRIAVDAPLPAPEKNDAPAPETTLPPPPPEAQKMTLAISAREETWMKIIIDGGKPKEYTLNSGDRLLLEAEAAFNLLIGNAGGVDLRLNDRPVESPGKSGQVITLQLP